MEFIFGIYIEEEGMDDWMVCASLCVAALAGCNKMQGPISHFPMNTTLLLSGIVPPACKMLNIIEYTPPPPPPPLQRTFMDAEFGRRLLAKKMAANMLGLLLVYKLMGINIVTTRGRITCFERLRSVYV